MKAVVQRVTQARVEVEGQVLGSIERGLLVYLGVQVGDEETDAIWLAEKIANLRILDDEEGRMNLSILDLHQKDSAMGVLVVSQFTLLGDARKGRRPSYGNAAAPERARELYEYFVEKLREQGLPCETGLFQALMRVSYTNEGPVTLLLDSKEVK